ncbi:MAG: hypothetical protein MHM6MM_007544 [Cercozoa sp. M6MM]
MAEINVSKVINIFNIVIGVLVFLTGFFTFGDDFRNTLMGIYLMAFGVLVTLVEFYIPNRILLHFTFVRSFIGRAFLYVFLGCVALTQHNDEGDRPVMAMVTGVMALTVAAVFIILQFAVRYLPL